jgi:2-polyprenyl-6-methoxyphenol hydroxylase-like FAD-dependent oxidoreductase
MAIESAAVLAACLGAHPEPTRAYDAFERIRRPRVRAIFNRSHRMARMGQWEHPAVCRARNHLMKVATRSAAPWGMRAMYRNIVYYDVFEELARAGVVRNA